MKRALLMLVVLAGCGTNQGGLPTDAGNSCLAVGSETFCSAERPCCSGGFCDPVITLCRDQSRCAVGGEGCDAEHGCCPGADCEDSHCVQTPSASGGGAGGSSATTTATTTGGSSTSGCVALLGACSDNSQCCSGHCALGSGQCAQSTSGGTTAGTTTSGNGGTTGGTCSNPGTGCSASTDCCSHACNNGVCG